MELKLDDKEVRVVWPDQEDEVVPWDELRAVMIETTGEGPFACDFFWVLVGDNGGCVVPQEAPGSEALLDRLQKLPGFDNQAVIDASASVENIRFLCWERDSDP